jgi:oligopeptide transport system permease protein
VAKYLIKRLLQSLVTIILIVSAVFLLMRMMPTDYYFSEDELMKLTEEQKQSRLEAEGLLDPPLVQLGNFLVQLAHFDLGTSRRIQMNKPVADVIGSRFAISMRMGLTALAIALAIGVVMGVLQARFKDRVIDHIGTGYTVFVNAVPHLVSYSLVLVFGARLLGLPSLYSVRKPDQSSILPIACLALTSVAGYMLWTRRYMVDELNKDYIRLAQLKGFTTTQVMFRHVMKNAFLPLAQYLPYNILLTVGGSLLAESFFSVPGMGPLLTQAISRYDTNLVQAIVLFYATRGVLGVFLGDLLMCILDPRISLTKKGGTR